MILRLNNDKGVGDSMRKMWAAVRSFTSTLMTNMQTVRMRLIPSRGSIKFSAERDVEAFVPERERDETT